MPTAIVRGSVDQTLHGALLQIQASTRVAPLCSASPGGQQAGCCHKGNHAVIHVSAARPVTVYEVLIAGLAPPVCGAVKKWDSEVEKPLQNRLQTSQCPVL